jgi:hypothetical protein
MKGYYNTLRPTTKATKPRQNTAARPQLTEKQLAASLARLLSTAQNMSAEEKAILPYDVGNVATPSIYGRCSIFDCCQPGDIFGLQVVTSGLMQWLGFRSNRFYQRRVGFIPWYGPENTVSGTVTTGAVGPCEDPDGWEYGVCGYNLYHKSWYGRKGEGLDPMTIVQDRCETTPRYRVNGVPIGDDLEWQMNGIMNVIQSDLRRGLIHGSHSNARQMNGLESLIKTGYTNDDGTTCPQIDSTLLNWAHDDLDGAVNGYGNFFNYLDELVTDIEYRAKDMGGISTTDMVLLTSRFMATGLLDAFSCYTTCGVNTDNDITDQALRAQARAARMALNAGPLYDGNNAVGYIQLKSGRKLPIIVDDFLDIAKNGSSYCTDIYLLTRRIGSIDVMYGEYLDMTIWENRVKSQLPNIMTRADAAGRFLVKAVEENFCVAAEIGTSPEIYLSAPWAQARIENVCTSRIRKPLTGDPFQPVYWPGGKPLHNVTMVKSCTDLDA